MTERAFEVVAIGSGAMGPGLPHINGEFQSEAADLATLWQRVLTRFDPYDFTLRAKVLKALGRAENMTGLWLMCQWLERGPISVAHTRPYFTAMARVARDGPATVCERAREWLFKSAKQGLHGQGDVRQALLACRETSSGLSRRRLERMLEAM